MRGTPRRHGALDGPAFAGDDVVVVDGLSTRPPYFIPRHTSTAAARSSIALPTDLNKVICLSEVRPLALPATSSNRSPQMFLWRITPRRSGITTSPASLSALARVST